MLLAKSPYLWTASLASFLLAGCCCPALSGRYYEVGMCPGPGEHGGSYANHAAGCHPGLRRPYLAANGSELFAPVPSEQHADYLSPLARFHPVPTRPVFTPVPSAHPPRLLDPVPKPLGFAAGH